MYTFIVYDDPPRQISADSLDELVRKIGESCTPDSGRLVINLYVYDVGAGMRQIGSCTVQ